MVVLYTASQPTEGMEAWLPQPELGTPSNQVTTGAM